MGTFWQDLKKTVQRGATTAVEKTEEYGKIGKIKIDILNLNKQLDRTLRELGEMCYENLKASKKKDMAKEEVVGELLVKIDELKALVVEKEAEIEKIKEESEAKKEEADADAEAESETNDDAKEVEVEVK